MKILYDSTELSYYLEKNGYRAGVFYVALNIFRELKKRNDIQITFICNFKRYYFMKEVMNKIPEFKGIELLEEKSLINKIFAWLNYSVRKLPRKFTYGALSISRYYENLFYKQNKKNIEQIKYFNIYFSPFTPPTEEVYRSEHIKRFLMLHDVIPILEEGEKIFKNPRLWCYRLYSSINENDYYLTNSENTKRDVMKYFPFISDENIKTALLGANEAFRPVQTSRKEKYVLSLCTLGKRKNLVFTIRNFFSFIEKNKIDDLKLVLAGGLWKKFEKDLQNTIKGFDKDKIELTGYVDEDKLPDLYSGASFFVFPSLYEGFGLPVLEAMKCGCPVITSKTSSLPEVIGDAGIKINPESDEEMTDAMTKMYKDEFFRELCSERGMIRARNFSWEKCTNEILDFINSKNTPNK